MAIIPGAGCAARNDSASGAQVIDGSLNFNPQWIDVSNTFPTNLSRTFPTAGNRKTWTWSGWVNRNIIGDNVGGDEYMPFFASDDGETNKNDYFFFGLTDECKIETKSVVGASNQFGLITNAQFRDPGWQHWVMAVDSTQATAANRIKIYINGVLYSGTYLTESWGTQNTDWWVNQAQPHRIGGDVKEYNLNGNMSQVYFIDGQQLEPTSFGYTDPLTNTWRPKKFTGDYITSKAVNDSGLPYSAVTRFSSYKEDATVNDNATGYTLPMSNPAHYGGKARDLSSGGFKVTTVNSAAQDFFMGHWVKFDNYTGTGQMGVDLTVDYVYFELRANGVIGIRHTGGSRSDSSATDIDDGNWHHIALSRTGGTLYGLLDGTAVVSTTGGVSGNSVGVNETFFFWAEYSSYNIDAQVIDPFVYIGQGVSSYTTPTAPLIDSSGNINYLSGFSSSQAYYISPGVTITGSSPNTANWPNSFYLPLDGNFPVGQDQSGNGNDFGGRSVGGSNVIEKATGALPILNTIRGGTTAVPGVRGQVGIAVTVYNSKYYLDGEEAPSLSQYRGQTITFDQSDSTNSGHPLRFATAADAAGSTEYTKSTITAGTPATTSYYGVDFDGSDFLKVEQSSSQFSGQGDYTVECWAKFDSFPADGALWSNWNNSSQDHRSILLEVNSSGGGFKFMINSGGGGGSWITLNAATPIPNTGQWYHLCQTYDHSATTTKCYIDGRFYGENTSTTVYNDSNADLHIGVNAGDANGKINGQVTNFRWSNSVRYTSEFIPSRTSFTSDGNTVFLGCLDSSAATTAVTNNAGTISASGDPSVYTVTNLYGPHTKITFPHDAPSTLYYYCTNHSGMGGSVGLSTDATKADPYASNCVLALPLAGTVEDVCVSVACTSTAHQITDTSTSRGSTGNFYGTSRYFGDKTQNYNLKVSESAAWDFGNASWTIECWVCSTQLSGNDNVQAPWSYNTQGASDYQNIGWIGAQRQCNAIGNDPESKVYIYYGTGGGYASKITSVPMSYGYGRWIHFATVWDKPNGKLRVYFDGQAVMNESITKTQWGYKETNLWIGDANWTTARPWDGWMQDFRVYKGAAKYSADFIPASSIPQITSQTPSGTSYGSEIIKASDGAVSFNGINSHLNITGQSDLAFGTGDFTVEFFVYFISTDGTLDTIMETRSSTGASDGFLIGRFHTAGHENKIELYTASDYRVTADVTVGNEIWVHVAAVRSSSVTKLYINGKAQSTTYSDSNDYSNDDLIIGENINNTYQIDGFISNFRLVKGTAVYTSDFIPPTEPLTNVTNTKLLCCQSNGSATTAAVTPGTITANGSAAASSFNPFNNDPDISSGSKTQYCTYNELDNPGDYNSRRDLSRCNLGVLVGGGNDSGWVQGTLPMSPGHGKKWYWEVTIPTTSNTAGKTYAGIGSRTSQTNAWLDQYCVQLKTAGEPRFYIDGTGYTDKGVGAWSTGQTLGLAFDPDAGILTYYRDGRVLYTQTGVSTSGVDIPWFPAFQCDPNSGPEPTFSNFGQMPFRFPPPDGYEPLCVANLPLPGATIPTNFVKPQAYTGNGGTNVIECGFQPDLVACKSTNNAWDWGVFDSVRSKAGNVYDYLKFNSDDVQATGGTTALQSYNEKGFTMGADAAFNTNNATFCSYNWKAGGNKNTFNVDGKGFATAASAGLDGGSITPTGASVGTRQGFSIIQYTGTGSAATISHGLSSAPEFIISKRINNSTSNWGVYHSSLGPTKVILLNTTGGGLTADTPWNDTSPTSSVWSVKSSNTTNNSGDSYIAYLWHNIPGVQKFGTYTGTGNTDTGPYIELGFKPALLICKNMESSSTDWPLADDATHFYNPKDAPLFTCYNNAQTADAGYKIDFVSSGFKVHNNQNSYNKSGERYIYMAWADQPHHNLYGALSANSS